MVGLIFGVILLIVGIVLAVVFSNIKETSYREDSLGNYVRDEHGNRIEDVTHPMKKFSGLSVGLGIGLCILLTFFGCLSSVDTGKTGVVTSFGRVEDYTYEAGFHLKAPWNNVVEMDNRVQKTTVELSCFSSDIQEVNMKYTLNYQIDKANAQEIYKSIGKDYYQTIVEPTIAECVKVATAKYTAEKLVQTRTELAQSIEDLLIDALAKYNIKVSSTAIEDMDFTDSFTNAVEAKQVAEQKKKQAIIEQEQSKLQAENEAEIAKLKAEADKLVAKTKAEAEAEVAKIQAEADMEVQKIGADAAAYAGQKEGSVALQRLAAINGWTVITDEQTGINKLYKADGSEVTAAELKVGTEKLIEYYYTQAWDGVLPQTYVGNDSIDSILIGNND